MRPSKVRRSLCTPCLRRAHTLSTGSYRYDLSIAGEDADDVLSLCEPVNPLSGILSKGQQLTQSGHDRKASHSTPIRWRFRRNFATTEQKFGRTGPKMHHAPVKRSRLASHAGNLSSGNDKRHGIEGFSGERRFSLPQRWTMSRS